MLRSSTRYAIDVVSGGSCPLRPIPQHPTAEPSLTLRVQRNVPARGFKPYYYLIGMHAIMAYGFYKYFHGVREQRYVWRIRKLPFPTVPRSTIGNPFAIDI